MVSGWRGVVLANRVSQEDTRMSSFDLIVLPREEFKMAVEIQPPLEKADPKHNEQRKEKSMLNC